MMVGGGVGDGGSAVVLDACEDRLDWVEVKALRRLERSAVA